MGCGGSTAKVGVEPGAAAPTGGSTAAAPPKKQRKAGSLGVIRLDYDYPPAPGDIDHPGSYAYDVYYRVVPGLTFAMCQSGKMTPEVEERFIGKVKELDALGVSGITGDCGFMMFFQALARKHTKKPVFMSALCQLPAVTCGYHHDEQIAIFTANGTPPRNSAQFSRNSARNSLRRHSAGPRRHDARADARPDPRRVRRRHAAAAVHRRRLPGRAAL